jgi:hypothetical protein
VIAVGFLANPWLAVAIFVAIGLCAGTVVGIVGGSGVIVVVPILALLGYTVHASIGTSLCVDVIASLVAAYTYWQNKRIDLSRGAWMGVTAVVGAQLGTIFATSLPSMSLGWAFVIFLFANGIVFLRTDMDKITARLSSFANEKIYGGSLDTPTGRRRAAIISAISGFGIGIISGVFGAGGGMMFLYVLILVLGYELHLAVGTSTFIMAITAASGTIGYAFHGDVDFLAAAIICVGTLVASRVGAKLANKWGANKLARAIAGILIALGVMMIFASLGIV